jgi:hypothetical protein
MKSPTLQKTRNYAQFAMTKENREVNLLALRPQHKKLRASMQRYGFLPAHPLHVRTNGGKYVVIDGQHRLAFAKEFGIDVYYVVDEANVDIAEVNQAQAGWRPIDYARKWSTSGRKDYADVLAFAETYGIPLATSFAINANTIFGANVSEKILMGEYKISSTDRAARIGLMFRSIWSRAKSMKDNALVNALYACTFVDGFEDYRIMEAAQKRIHLFSKQPTRDAYLQLLEEVYNFNRKVRVPIKFEAEEAMRKRSDVTNVHKRRNAKL